MMGSLSVGDRVDNHKLVSIFGCSPQGGMRRAHRSNSLVIVSNHIESIYDDRWIDGILYYTGMGRVGDQSFSFMQNPNLQKSDTNGIRVHLFEVFLPQQYTYIGEVELAAEPFFEDQPDKNGNMRKACVFPLRLKGGEPPIIPSEVLNKSFEIKAKKAKKLGLDELRRRAETTVGNPGPRATVVSQHPRNPWVVELAKRASGGICQLCESPAPFLNKAKEAYLEAHHIEWLSRGGSDSIDNVVALCPNCHRKMHVLDKASDKRKLKKKALNALSNLFCVRTNV